LPLSREAATTVESIRNDYMQFLDEKEFREMKATFNQQIEELKEMIKKGK
jgi:hypothetical protein